MWRCALSASLSSRDGGWWLASGWTSHRPAPARNVGRWRADDEAETTTLSLNTAEKTAYLTTLAPARPGGPWLVGNTVKAGSPLARLRRS